MREKKSKVVFEDILAKQMGQQDNKKNKKSCSCLAAARNA
jgi:hypothetical protein